MFRASDFAEAVGRLESLVVYPRERLISVGGAVVSAVSLISKEFAAVVDVMGARVITDGLLSGERLTEVKEELEGVLGESGVVAARGTARERVLAAAIAYEADQLVNPGSECGV
jgi:hypothetical protein